jgi:xanthine dehydrogenase large subunit
MNTIGTAVTHESAHLHVTGKAPYVDDVPETAGTLHAALGLSTHAHAKLIAIDLTLVKASPGVVGVLTSANIIGDAQWGAMVRDDLFLAKDSVHFVGQAIFMVIARSYHQARIAARLAKIHYEPLAHVLSIEQAKAQKRFFGPPIQLLKGDCASALSSSAHRATGSSKIGAQEHFYLEGQIALATPLEDGQMHILTSSQHPSEMQQVVASICGLAQNQVVSQTRRMGGGFGGKEVQPAQFAGLAALGAKMTGKPVKLRLDRDDDMLLTGKRHAFEFHYDVGFDQNGVMSAFDIELNSQCGYSTDYSHAVNDRALCHLDNSYFHEHIRVLNHRCQTNTQSATAFRGFGAPQGMFAIEHAIETIARQLHQDPLDIRKRNLYGHAPRNTTHYGTVVQDFWIPAMLDQLEASCQYRQRKAAIQLFNATSPVVKKGIAITPVMFGVSFNASFLNRGSAMVSLYLDGSLAVNHAGTEMGQGLYTKIAQIVANEFGVPSHAVKQTATDTTKLPNTSPTAASSGTDVNGMAALNACRELKTRLTQFLAQYWQVTDTSIQFADGSVRSDDNSRSLTLAQLAKSANFARVHLVALGFYNTPDIHWNSKTYQGKPFYYFSYGVCCSEVSIDTLTGEHRLDRVDILQDVGQSVNPAIDLGQIEGGFIQGVGYLTSEEIVWDAQGQLRTHAPSTYKIPTAGDCPKILNIEFFNRPNPIPTVYHSKAVGEPPLMLALSVWFAIADAVSSLASSSAMPDLSAPATPEAILNACNAMRKHA